MVFKATFNNISVNSWRSVLLVETGVSGENHQAVASHSQTLSHDGFLRLHLSCSKIDAIVVKIVCKTTLILNEV